MGWGGASSVHISRVQGQAEVRREERIERALGGHAGHARGRSRRWIWLALHPGDGAHDVLDDEVLRGLGPDDDAAGRARVLWLRRAEEHHNGLALGLPPGVRGEIGAREEGAEFWAQEPLRVVVGVHFQVFDEACAEPVLYAALAERVTARETGAGEKMGRDERVSF